MRKREPWAATANPQAFSTMTTTCLLAWAAILLTLPIILLLWATQSRPQRIHRLRSYGWSQQRIATHLHISRYAVRQALA